MNNIEQLAFEYAFSLLKQTYRSVDLRALLLKEKTGWNCLLLVFRPNVLSKNQIHSIHERIKERVIQANSSDLRIVLQEHDISNAETIMSQIKKGQLEIDGITATINNSHRATFEKETIREESAYSENGFPALVLLCPNDRGQSPIKVLSEHGIRAADVGFRNLSDVKIWFDVNLTNTVGLIFILSVYSKVLSKFRQRGKGIFYYTIHEA